MTETREAIQIYQEAQADPIPSTDDPLALADALRKTRSWVETLHAKLLVCIHNRTHAAVAELEAQAIYDDAWQAAMNSTTAMKLHDTAPRERYALYDLRCMEEKGKLRDAQRAKISAEEAEQLTRAMYSDLRDRERLLDSLLRALPTIARLST